MKRIGILYHPKVAASSVLGEELVRFLREQGVEHWLGSAWEEAPARSAVAGTDLIITLGGDGTILRAARIIVPHAVPILAVNLGKLGFLAEIAPDRAREDLRRVLAGEGWIEERMMLEAEVRRADGTVAFFDSDGPLLYALNDVVVGRGRLSRVVYMRTTVDGSLFTTYTGDGLIVASPTGSTSYSLAAGGPIVHPQTAAILLTPIAPYLALSKAVMLPPTAEVEVKVETDHYAAVSVDGQVELELGSGDIVCARRSSHVTRFLRLRPPSYFLRTLTERLGREVRPCWLNSASPTSP